MGLILTTAELVPPRLASSLHYKMSFDAEFVRVDPLVAVDARVQGRVEGSGLWSLSDIAGGTLVRFDWLVTTGRLDAGGRSARPRRLQLEPSRVDERGRRGGGPATRRPFARPSAQRRRLTSHVGAHPPALGRERRGAPSSPEPSDICPCGATRLARLHMSTLG